MSDSYHDWIDDKAAELGADGCSGVSGAYVWCCKEHDVHWRIGTRRNGTPISRTEADLVFRSCIQRCSPFGFWSPMAWWRWLGLKWFGKPAPILGLLTDQVAQDAARRREQILREEGLL